MDAFYASIEQLDHPDLRGKPVLVGGEGPRAVIAAASYEARAFGCHSAQPTAIAKRRCPQAVIMPPRGGRYGELSQRVFEILEAFSPLVQPLSIDEAFVDVTGSQRLLGPPPQIAAAIKRRILDELGLTASIGVAPNKFLAKLASDLDKPDGLTVIEPGRIRQRIDDLPVRRMWGVGPVTEQRLLGLGVRTFGDLRRAPARLLETVFGRDSARIVALADGRDQREVTPDSGAKSISQEQTFGHDLDEPDHVRAVLLGQVEQVGRRLRKHGLGAQTATVKIRFGNFETITRSSALDEPADRTDQLWQAARRCYDRWAADSFRPVRLIGFGASRLVTGGDQLALFTQPADERRQALDRVTDSIQAKYGSRAIHRGAREARSPRENG